jgi:CheY-like chemotaxis protein
MNKKIILVDDDFYFARSVKELLEDEGFEVITADDFKSAKIKISEHPDAAIIALDIMMPSDEEFDIETRKGFKSGIVLARWIKENHPNIKIIGMSGVNSVETERWFEKHGIPFFMKGSDALLDELNKLMTTGGDKRLRSFIVHGHDEQAKYQLKNYLQNTLKFPEPIILHELPSLGRTIIEKFEETAGRVDLVFVLLTPDDTVYDSSTPDDLKRRARQNVIFEMGYFFAKLQRTKGKVILLNKGQLELPSDIGGITYIDISNGIESAGEQIRKELSL